MAVLLIISAMSRSRKNKAARPNKIVAYMKIMSNRSISEDVQSENEESLTLGTLKELITSEFSKVTGDQGSLFGYPEV